MKYLGHNPSFLFIENVWSFPWIYKQVVDGKYMFIFSK